MPTTISAEKPGQRQPQAAETGHMFAGLQTNYKQAVLCLVQRHLSESRQANSEFRMAVLFALLETPSKPPEGSVVEIEPALAEPSRIHPFAA